MEIKAPEAAMNVCRTLTDAGHQAFLVGGCVRDSILGLEPKDWDVATDAHPEVVMGLFRRVHPTGIDFGTVTVVDWEDPIEVTTFRDDGNYSDGRRPDAVTFSKTIEEDLSRRDFTVNAMAFDPVAGRLVDPFGGIDHINERLLHAVGDAHERFREDGLRILRAVRFASTKDFGLSDGVDRAIRDSLDMLSHVSKERIRDEIMKMLGGDPVFAVTYMQEAGLWGRILPELEKQVGLSQNRHHAYNVWDHTVACVGGDRTGRSIIRLAILLHDVAKPATRAPHPDPERAGDFQFLTHEHLGAEMAEEWMREFKFSNDEIELVTHCIKNHLIYYDDSWSDRQLRRWLRKVGEKHLDELLEVRRADICGKGPDVDHFLSAHEELRARIKEVNVEVPHSTAHLAVRGKEVMALRGMTKGGPLVGRILDHLLDVVTDEPGLNNVDDLSRIVREFEE